MIQKFAIVADVQIERFRLNSADTFYVSFTVLLLSSEIQMESLVTQC